MINKKITFEKATTAHKEIILIIFCCVLNTSNVQASFAKKVETIYVYNDKGVSQKSLEQTISTFHKLLKNYPVKTINAQQVKEGSWSKNAILFVMPGGFDLPYVKKLNGIGNEIIKNYVINGGSFIGICAGSYYASSYVEFDKNGTLEILGNRELGFFKGNAVGPVLAPYDYKTQSGSRAAMIHTNLPNAKKIRVFYNGGGFFKNAENYPNTSVVATYNNKLPAIILINYSKGRVLLSGVHFEYDPYLLNSKNEYIKQIISPLLKHNVSREIFFYHLMRIVSEKINKTLS